MLYTLGSNFTTNICKIIKSIISVIYETSCYDNSDSYYCFLGCGTVCSGRWAPEFRRNRVGCPENGVCESLCPPTTYQTHIFLRAKLVVNCIFLLPSSNWTFCMWVQLNLRVWLSLDPLICYRDPKLRLIFFFSKTTYLFGDRTQAVLKS